MKIITEKWVREEGEKRSKLKKTELGDDQRFILVLPNGAEIQISEDNEYHSGGIVIRGALEPLTIHPIASNTVVIMTKHKERKRK
jgi:hypothetical protein